MSDPLPAALATVGLVVSDLSLAVISHLHLDHSGGIPLLAEAGVPVALQRAELDFAHSGRAVFVDGFRVQDWSDPRTRWELVDGDAERAPGVSVLATPRHNPGHSSLWVELPQTGTWIFAADAADLGQNLLDRVPCGYCPRPAWPTPVWCRGTTDWCSMPSATHGRDTAKAAPQSLNSRAATALPVSSMCRCAASSAAEASWARTCSSTASCTCSQSSPRSCSTVEK